MPLALAVKVMPVAVPPSIRLSPVPWVRPPLPAKAVPIVRPLERLLVSTVGLVMVILGNDMAAELLSDWVADVLKVCMPLPVVNVLPLWVMPPRYVTAELPELFQVLPAAVVMAPTKILVPVAELITRLPLVPPPTVVVPLTVRSKPAAVKVVPSPIAKLPPIFKLTAVVVLAVPVSVRSPLMVVVVALKVLAAEPENMRSW